MSSARKHLRNARRNLEAAEKGSADPSTRSWAAVALFYAAHQLVHAVLDGEQALAEEMRHPLSHGTSKALLGTSDLVSQLYGRDIGTAYKSLFGTGKGVRYEGALVSEVVYEGLREGDYAAIAAWAREKLAQQDRTLDPDFP